MRSFDVDLTHAESFQDFVDAFNDGFCLPVMHSFGDSRETHLWEGRNWNAFHDYLSWPQEQDYVITFKGWNASSALTVEEREMVLSILRDSPHVRANFT